jgi:hypothetical protein
MTSNRVQPYSSIVGEGRRSNALYALEFFSLFLDLSLFVSLSLFSGTWKEATQIQVRGCKCVKGQPPAFIAPWCYNRGGQIAGPYKRSKPMFTSLPHSSHDVLTTMWDTVTISKTCPIIVVGLI